MKKIWYNVSNTEIKWKSKKNTKIPEVPNYQQWPRKIVLKKYFNIGYTSCTIALQTIITKVGTKTPEIP